MMTIHLMMMMMMMRRRRRRRRIRKPLFRVLERNFRTREKALNLY
jgi:hypothetical protein